jgi:hypothetical protein
MTNHPVVFRWSLAPFGLQPDAAMIGGRIGKIA